jgi:hypothetical protein
MIDTIKLKLFASPFKKLAGVGWKMDTGTRERDREDGEVRWTKMQHTESALRVYGTGGMAETLEVSLPRLLHGCNGRLLRPHEVNMAYYAALDLATDVVEDLNPEKLTRLDLVHHFEGWAFDFIASLWGLKHRSIRNKQVQFFETSLSWPGKEMKINLYDKKAELCSIPGYVQRLEAQLHGSKLPDVWSASGGFRVEECYKEYRKICSGFAARRIPILGSLEELLHWLKENEVKVRGVDPVERYLACKSRTTRYRINKALNDVNLKFFEANFLDHLPAQLSELIFIDCLPDVDPDQVCVVTAA